MNTKAKTKNQTLIKQGSLEQLRSGELNRTHGYIVVAMAYFPRGLQKNLMDEYRTHLSPDRVLFHEWKELEGKIGHEEAFKQTDYEARFTLEPGAVESLRRLVDVSRKQDVYFICQCAVGQRCHREMIALYAQVKFRAEIAPLHNEYPVFKARLTIP